MPPLTHTYDPRIAGCRAKKAKTILASLAASPNNQELRHLTDAGAVPDWFPGIQEVWKHAMNHVSHLNLTAQESPCRFVLPPIHLFWVVSLRTNVSTTIITSYSSMKSRIDPSATFWPSPLKNGGLF
jgi:hypothetical protein